MEEWKSVKGFEDYEVSNLGRIRRVTTGQGAVVGAVLKAHPNNYGYPMVSLRNKGKTRTKTVHRLVAQAFIPNPLKLPEVNHKGSKTDCRALKLEWISFVEHGRNRALRKQIGDGVHFNRREKKWKAVLYLGPKQKKHVGTYSTKSKALYALNKKEKR